MEEFVIKILVGFIITIHVILTIPLGIALFVYSLHKFLSKYAFWLVVSAVFLSLIICILSILKFIHGGIVPILIIWNLITAFGFIRLYSLNPAKNENPE
jgi:hypothetical protein